MMGFFYSLMWYDKFLLPELIIQYKIAGMIWEGLLPGVIAELKIDYCKARKMELTGQRWEIDMQ